MGTVAHSDDLRSRVVEEILAGASPQDYFQKKLHAAEQHGPDVAQARELWKASQASLDPTKLVFVDETGANTKMVRA